MKQTQRHRSRLVTLELQIYLSVERYNFQRYQCVFTDNLI